MSDKEEPKYGINAQPDTPYVLDGQTYTGDPAPLLERKRQEEAARRAAEKQAAAASQSQPAFPPGNPLPGTPGIPTPPGPGSFNPPVAPPAQPGPGYGSPVPPPAAPGGPYASAPYPVAPGGYSGFTPPPVVPPQLPSRRGPISVLVSGILMMVLVAPVVFVLGMVMSFMNVNMHNESDTNTVTIADSQPGVVVVAAYAEGKGSWQCQVDLDGKKIAPLSDQETQQLTDIDEIAVFNGAYMINKAGTLNVKCENTSDSSAVAQRVEVITNIGISGFIYSFLVSTLIGLVGLGFVIWGAIWLVRRNRLRREVMYGRF